MQIVTGYRGQAHITSNDDQGRNQGVFGQNSYVLSVGSQFAPTLVSANELRIADGEAVMQGVHFRVDPSSFDSVTITNGTQGMNRKDLVVCRYTKDGSTGVENCEWVVIEGTPTSGTAARPSAVSGDILDGALVADMPFFEIVLSGINVTAVNSLFSKLMTMQEIQALAKTNESGISELNSKIGSRVDITSSTTSTTGTVGEASYVTAGNLVFLHVSLSGMQVSANTNYWVHLPDSFPGNSDFFCPLSASYTGIVCVFRTQGSGGKYILVQSPTAINNLTLNISGICLKA